MFKKILVPTDGSGAALQAARAIGQLLASAPGSRVTVALVIAPLELNQTDFEPEFVERHNETMRRKAEQALSSTAAILAEHDVAATIKLLQGNPVSAAIAREAHNGGYDLIAMSSRGLAQQRDDLHYIGSVTQHVIRRSQIPVLVIPAPEA